MLTKFINNVCEDSLTASVFSHLLHLTSAQFWRILGRACYTTTLLEDFGEPLIVDPWPKWNPADTGTNNTYVEPDLFMRFTDFDLIVESKRWDNGMQDPAQWKRELIAYTNEYGKDRRQVRMIALGGIRSENDHPLSHAWRESKVEDSEVSDETHLFNCTVHMCRWSALLHECQRLKRELLESVGHAPSSRTFADIRIMNDLITFFETYGFPALCWYKDFDFASKIPGPTIDSNQQYFRNICLQLQAL